MEVYWSLKKIKFVSLTRTNKVLAMVLPMLLLYDIGTLS